MTDYDLAEGLRATAKRFALLLDEALARGMNIRFKHADGSLTFSSSDGASGLEVVEITKKVNY